MLIPHVNRYQIQALAADKWLYQLIQQDFMEELLVNFIICIMLRVKGILFYK